MKQKLTTLLLLLIAFCFSGCDPESKNYIIVESVSISNYNDWKYRVTFVDDYGAFGQAYFYTNKLYQVGDTLK